MFDRKGSLWATIESSASKVPCEEEGGRAPNGRSMSCSMAENIAETWEADGLYSLGKWCLFRMG